jgi:hypothetical protein
MMPVGNRQTVSYRQDIKQPVRHGLTIFLSDISAFLQSPRLFRPSTSAKSASLALCQSTHFED